MNQADELIRRLDAAAAGFLLTENVVLLRKDVIERIIREDLPEPQTEEQMLHQIELILEDWKQHGNRNRIETAARILRFLRPERLAITSDPEYLQAQADNESDHDEQTRERVAKELHAWTGGYPLMPKMQDCHDMADRILAIIHPEPGLTEEQIVNLAGEANAKLHEIFRETDGHEREYCVHGYIEDIIKKAITLSSTPPAKTADPPLERLPTAIEDRSSDITFTDDEPAEPTCDCTKYNGGQCYNCLNGAHDVCDNGHGRCSLTPTAGPTGMLSTHLGLLRVAIIRGDPKDELLARVEAMERLPEAKPADPLSRPLNDIETMAARLGWIEGYVTRSVEAGDGGGYAHKKALEAVKIRFPADPPEGKR